MWITFDLNQRIKKPRNVNHIARLVGKYAFPSLGPVNVDRPIVRFLWPFSWPGQLKPRFSLDLRLAQPNEGMFPSGSGQVPQSSLARRTGQLFAALLMWETPS